MRIRYTCHIPYTNPQIGDKIKLIRHEFPKTKHMMLGGVYTVTSLRDLKLERPPYSAGECVVGIGDSNATIYFLNPKLFVKV